MGIFQKSCTDSDLGWEPAGKGGGVACWPIIPAWGRMSWRLASSSGARMNVQSSTSPNTSPQCDAPVSLNGFVTPPYSAAGGAREQGITLDVSDVLD